MKKMDGRMTSRGCPDTSAWAEITMIQSYGAVVQIDDTKNCEHSNSEACNCGKTITTSAWLLLMKKCSKDIWRMSEGCPEDV